MRIGDLLVESHHVGGVFSPGHEHCKVLTNDKWTQDAGGLPRHSLLIARPLLEGDEIVSEEDVHTGHRLPESDPGYAPPDPTDTDATHALLLRVSDTTDIPQEGRLQTNRYDAIQEAITGEGGGTASPEDFVDVLTRRQIQYSGVEAKILGTFYYDTNEDDEQRLSFSSDVQTFFSAGHYVVHKPDHAALQWIASYPTTADTKPVKLGDVQYTTTDIWGDGASAGMYFDVEEFIGAKTAVFGMTRKGKSNTMKIIAGAIEAHDESIGQLIFDPSGEYAYVNDQDEECALGELHAQGDDGDLEAISTVYKFAAQEDETDRYKPLRTNLLARSNLDVVKNYVRMELGNDSATYTENFVTVSNNIPSEDDLEDMDGGQQTRAEWLRSAYYAVISRAIGTDDLPDDFETMWISVRDEVLEIVNDNSHLDYEKKGPSDDVPLGKWDGENTLVEFWSTVAANTSDINDAYPEDRDWVNDDLDNVLEMFRTAGSQSGFGKLRRLQDYHNPAREVNVAEEIYDLLTDGELVVVDISNGLEEVITAEKERLVRYILNQSMDRFRSTDEDELPKIQIYLEEAHQHFDEYGRDDGEMNPFVTLAKEGAKFKIGMAYATQEVTSVDPRVRANTANWIVTHLNSEKEINELGKYYNYDDFENSIRNVETVGYSRVKTYKGEYIVPVQISLFDTDWVKANTPFGVKKDDEFIVEPNSSRQAD
ncbi:hypothetical protein C500_20621 [Natrialba magadii ATCC 43099]|nr:hypothetical protein C500_20621 [Natrialba magadii ATCC 43099]